MQDIITVKKENQTNLYIMVIMNQKYIHKDLNVAKLFPPTHRIIINYWKRLGLESTSLTHLKNTEGKYLPLSIVRIQLTLL